MSVREHPVELSLKHELARASTGIVTLDALIEINTNALGSTHLGELLLGHTMVGVGFARTEPDMKVLIVTAENQMLDELGVGTDMITIGVCV